MRSEDRVHRVGETYIDVPTDEEVLNQKEHRILNAKIRDLESRLQELERTNRMESKVQ